MSAMNFGAIAGIDKPVSRLVFGTARLTSRRAFVLPSVALRRRAFKLLDDVHAVGCNAFDTAAIYQFGASERELGAWMRARGLRDRVVIVTKGGHGTRGVEPASPEAITRDLHDSVCRLRSEYIDLFLVHRDNPERPVGTVCEILCREVRAGTIRAFGFSNWSHQRIAEATDYCRAQGLTLPAASSPHLSLADWTRAPWEGCLTIAGARGAPARTWYAATQLPVMVWSPLAGGFLTGRFSPQTAAPRGYWDRIALSTYASEANYRRLERAQQLGREKGIAVTQIALAFVFNQGLNAFAIVSCETASRFDENVRACTIRLTPEELAWLDLSEVTKNAAPAAVGLARQHAVSQSEWLSP